VGFYGLTTDKYPTNVGSFYSQFKGGELNYALKRGKQLCPYLLPKAIDVNRKKLAPLPMSSI